MANILITGVAGFIGSNFAHYIAKNSQDHIIGIDNLSPYSCRENIRDLEATGRLIFFQEDITNYDGMKTIYEKNHVDYVVNFAAESHNDRAVFAPTSFARVNALGAQNLLEVSRYVGVRRHIHVSTIEVYGEQDEYTDFFTEGSPLNAKTPYSAAKAAGDMFVRAYMQTYRGMDICMTHCANNYGPYQFPEKLVPLTVANILAGKKAPLYGNGLQQRDWLHVLDHCRAIDLVLRREGAFTFPEEAATRPELLPIFDISAREVITNKDIVTKIILALGKNPDECIEYVADRPNHDRKYLINPKKIETALGFSPSIAFEDGIRETVAWYVQNEYWLKRIAKENAGLQINWNEVQIPGLIKSK